MSTLINHSRNVFNRLSRYCGIALLLLLTTSANAVEQVTYYHLDGLGSTVAATDENGALLWKEAYRPFGDRIRKEDGDTNDIWYTGKPHEEEMGLSYFGARWYDPTIGRFMGIDPVGVDEGNIHSFNRYAYANNNPYKFVDPDGRSPIFSGSATDRFGTAGMSGLRSGRLGMGNHGGLAERAPGFVPRGPLKNASGNLDAAAGAARTNPGANSGSQNVKKVLDAIKEGGFKVKINPKNPATKQEGNATVDFGNGTKVNLRVESHPLKQNGKDVRHANVEVTRQVKNKNKVISNKHIVK